MQAVTEQVSEAGRAGIAQSLREQAAASAGLLHREFGHRARRGERAVEFGAAVSFKYSARPGTPAAGRAEVPPEIADERSMN